MVCFDTIYDGTRTKTIDTINTKAKEDFEKERLKVDIRMQGWE
ncbi:hypothetical protein [Bacteroides faecium]